MLKDNPEKRLEREITALEESQIDAEITRVNSLELTVEVNFDGHKINESLEMDITFLLVVGPNFPYKPPRLYCMTLFCLPSIADGRDLLEDVMSGQWITSTRLIEVIQRIPAFLFAYIGQLLEGKIMLVGSFYLGERYEMNRFNSLPVFFHKIKERVMVGNKIVEHDNRFLMISDLYICVFEHDRWTLKNSNLTLLSYAYIRSILSIKKIADENLVRFVFKDKYKKPNYELVFTIESTSDDFITNILKIMGMLKIKYNVKKTQEKTGEIPQLDIKGVEEDIAALEERIEKENRKEDTELIMELYKKAIEYYSATNDAKYELYLGKLHDMIGSPRVKDILNDINNNLKQQANRPLKEGERTENNKQEENPSVIDELNHKEIIHQQPEILKNSDTNTANKDIKKENKEIEKQEELKKIDVETKERKVKPIEKKEKSKSSNEPVQTQDGITIEGSDELPNFDEGEESPDSD